MAPMWRQCVLAAGKKKKKTNLDAIKFHESRSDIDDGSLNVEIRIIGKTPDGGSISQKVAF